MVGGFNEYFVGKHLAFWSDEEDNPTTQELQKVETFYKTAVEYTPNNPGLHQVGGRLSEWQAYVAPDESEEQKKYRQESLERFRRSTQLRPTWPYAWFDLAKAKIRALEPDEEFQTALHKAITLGQNEPDIQQGTMQLGLLAWRILNQEIKASVLDTIKTLHQQNPKKLYQGAKDYDRQDLLCSLVDC